MGIDVDSGHVPGKKEGRPSAHARPWSPAVRRRLGAAGITAAILGVAACSSSGPGGPAAPAGQSSVAASAAPSAAAPAPGSASSGAASSLEQQYEQVVARVLPSVVQISAGGGSGSGVVYDARGDIVTNAHVVGTAATVQVGLASGGRPLAATVIGVFAPDDLAVIRVQAGAAAGIGFAIPSDTVTGIAAQLAAAGKVTSSGRASLGITAQTVADAAGQPAGVGVAAVTSGGAAARAGITAGDIITALAGQPTLSLPGLQSVLAAHKPGDHVQAQVSRDGTTSTVTITLGSLTS